MSRVGRHADAVKFAKKVLYLNSDKLQHYKNLASALEQSGQITEVSYLSSSSS